jgi:hypothetical protein
MIRNIPFLLLFFSPFVQCAQEKSKSINQPSESGLMIESSLYQGTDITESYRGIKILNSGPTGSKFTNSKRGEFMLLIFCIQIINDTIVPIDLEIQFPLKPTPLLPDSLTKVELLLLPESITPDTIQNAFNWGIIGIEEYFNSNFTDPVILKTKILPKEQRILYLGMLSESNKKHGTFRANLFLNGQNIREDHLFFGSESDAPFLPATSIETEKTEYSSLELVYGIGFAPHNQYTLIPCGQINYLTK